MSWIEENAINRIYRTFKRLKSGIFQEDINALKILNETIENNQNKAVSDNILFAKMLCTVLKQNVVYYHDISFSIKQASQELDKTLNEHLQELTFHLNQVRFIDKSEKGELTAQDILEEKKWTIEQVNSSFLKTANEFIKDQTKYF